MEFKPHHIAFTVNNLDESVKWYQEKLGFFLLTRYDAHNLEIAHIQQGGVRIELFSHRTDIKPMPEYRKDLMSDLHVVGTKHLCLQVQDITAVIEELKRRGVEFITEIDTAGFGGKYVFLKDCNGILIELYQD